MNYPEIREKIIKTVIFWSVLLGGVVGSFLPLPVQAQIKNPCDENPNNCLIDVDGEGQNAVIDFVQTLTSFLIYISAGIAVLFVVYGGFLYLTSAGDEQKAKSGLETVKNALIGLMLVIFSYTIVNTLIIISKSL